MWDFIWGRGTKLANHLQTYGFMPNKLRNNIRSLAHFLINDPKKRIIELKYGYFMLRPAGHKGSRSYKNGTYEESLFDFLIKHINKNETLIDIGAFIGY